MNPEETSPPVEDLVNAIEQHHWPLVAGLGIALAIYAANRANLLKKVPPKYIPVIAAALGILQGVQTQLATGMSWEEALGKGFLAGAAATGFWEMSLKHFLKFPISGEVSKDETPPSEEKTEMESATEAPKEEPAKEKTPAPKKTAKEKPVSTRKSVKKTPPKTPEVPEAVAPVEPAPVEPAPVEPAPVEPAPVPEAAPKKRGRPRKNQAV